MFYVMFMLRLNLYQLNTKWDAFVDDMQCSATKHPKILTKSLFLGNFMKFPAPKFFLWNFVVFKNICICLSNTVILVPMLPSTPHTHRIFLFIYFFVARQRLQTVFSKWQINVLSMFLSASCRAPTARSLPFLFWSVHFPGRRLVFGDTETDLLKDTWDVVGFFGLFFGVLSHFPRQDECVCFATSSLLFWC